jgi:7-cyano-7-deazaguanine reductase
MSTVPVDHLKALGASSQYDFDGPHSKLLECFPNPFKEAGLIVPGATGSVVIRAPEFTSLCPLTGQPDFATIHLEYVPEEYCVESKSWKLYLGSYRNARDFHESCVARMGRDLVTLLQPVSLTLRGEFTPRGGIPFWPTFTYARGKRPANTLSSNKTGLGPPFDGTPIPDTNEA